MTKKELIDFMSDYPDDALVVIEVHDATLYEDLYDFTFDGVSWTRTFPNGTANRNARTALMRHKPQREMTNFEKHIGQELPQAILDHIDAHSTDELLQPSAQA